MLQWAPELAARMNNAILGHVSAVGVDWRALPAGTFRQSQPDLHDLPQLAEFVSHARTCAQSVLRFLHVTGDALEMTGCWINVNTTGSGHRVHSHPNIYLSAVYYVQTTQGANTINFHDPRPQTSVLRPPITELGGQNADQAVVTVGDGTLLLFPAYLPHSVPTNESSEPRISVSFNLMFENFSKRVSPPQWTGTEAPR
jgi:uncharacterized protein (TIGR02466 family)